MTKRKPPLVKGGQGRTDAEVYETAAAFLGFVMLAATIAGVMMLISWVVN